jgi:hypothetical protein
VPEAQNRTLRLGTSEEAPGWIRSSSSASAAAGVTSGACDGACWSERCELGVRSTSVEDRAGRATDAAAATAATAAAATAAADHVKWRIAIEASKAEA